MIAMPDLAMLVLVALATTRLVGLWLDDEIARPVRDRVLAYLGEWRDANGSPFANWLLTLLTCAWCVSFWIGGVVATFAYHLPSNPVVVIVLMALFASQIAGMVGNVGRE